MSSNKGVVKVLNISTGITLKTLIKKSLKDEKLKEKEKSSSDSLMSSDGSLSPVKSPQKISNYLDLVQRPSVT